MDYQYQWGVIKTENNVAERLNKDGGIKKALSH